MKKKISLQGNPSDVDIQSVTSDSISFSLGGFAYSFEVVHRYNNRKMVLRSVETAKQYIASVGIPAKSGTTTVQLKNSDVTIRPVTRGAQVAQISSESGISAVAPLSGIIRAIKVNKGDTVTEGTTVAIIEAMKMQMTIEAQAEGKVVEIHVKENEEVREGALLVEISN